MTRELLDRYGLRPKTSIGQHFVTDPNTIRKVVKLAGIRPGMQVLEIGPGLGALSLAILDAGARLVAVEVDRALEPVLAEVLAGRRARVVFADAMAVSYRRLLGHEPTALVANLPYQIATPLIVDLLEEVPAIQSFTVMIQREVGERLAAKPGEEAYGAVSAKVAFLATAAVVARVSRRVFYPMPEVESVIVRIDRRARPAERVARARIFRVIEAGFAQRRKTIRRALRGAGWSADDVERALERAGIAVQARAETLGVPEFAALARALPARVSSAR
ncbi:MAG: 16S rRNA (adenine(1518)-N(6)/adenine(1519)-N(6))-dimethyltransferase RsmA [Actinomycetota bacterium]